MSHHRTHGCLRCGYPIHNPGQCCRSCRSTAYWECKRLAAEWKLERARREGRRLRLLHRGAVPWAATGPLDTFRQSGPVEVPTIDVRYLPRRTA